MPDPELPYPPTDMGRPVKRPGRYAVIPPISEQPIRNESPDGELYRVIQPDGTPMFDPRVYGVGTPGFVPMSPQLRILEAARLLGQGVPGLNLAPLIGGSYLTQLVDLLQDNRPMPTTPTPGSEPRSVAVPETPAPEPTPNPFENRPDAVRGVESVQTPMMSFLIRQVYEGHMSVDDALGIAAEVDRTDPNLELDKQLLFRVLQRAVERRASETNASAE